MIGERSTCLGLPPSKSKMCIVLPAALTVALASATCVDDPSPPTCRAYHYPNASADLSDICSSGMMSSMSGCSVRKQCMASGGGARGAACDDFSLLLRVCAQMPMMRACAAADSLCANGSAVAQCTAEPTIIKHLPTASEARTAALSVCAMMPKMAACSTCADSSCPDPLLSLSHLCQAMPGMASCAGWEAWCRQPGGVDTLPAFCAGVPPVGGGGVPMRMYFHLDFRDYILFESWVPATLVSYLSAILAVTVAGIASAWLRAVRAVYESRAWRKKRGSVRQHLMRANATRAGLVVVSTALDYCLMLVAMTFNVGLFLAVCIGLGLGTLAFGHWGREPPPDDYDCCSTNGAAAEREAPFLDSGPCH